jgi:hypothetical protein
MNNTTASPLKQTTNYDISSGSGYSGNSLGPSRFEKIPSASPPCKKPYFLGEENVNERFCSLKKTIQ